MDEDRLGALLAAIGNHEAKALTFLAMEDDVSYGVTSIQRCFLDFQGSPSAFTGQITTAQKYLLHSFAPIGLVAREHNANGFLRHIKDDPGQVAGALAGFLLARTQDLDIALLELFGKTSVSMGAHERSPIRRYRIMRALAGAPAETYPTEVAEIAQVRDTTTAHALATFARFGLVSYRTDPTYTMRTTYRVSGPIPIPRIRGEAATQKAVIAYLNARLATCPGELTITRDEVEAHVRSLPRWAEVESLRDVLQGVMKRLERRGAVEVLTAHYGATHARVEIGPAQREFFDGLVRGIAEILDQHPAAITAGVRDAARILDNPEAVRHLIRKAFTASKLANNP